jgi:RNA polymerase sigma-70 factor, ECF subfamily
MAEPAVPVQSIVEELQAGRSFEENFSRLVDLYHRPVYRFFTRQGFAAQDCLDLTQETFLGIYRGIGSFRGDARFETWLFRVATNAGRKRVRSAATGKRAGQEVPLDGAAEPDEPSPTGEIPSAGPAPPDALLAEERRRLLREAIERLPDQMRRCLVLRVDRELKVRDVATLLRLSPETVKAHLFQARKRLQAELGTYFAGSLNDEAAP